MEQPQPNVLGFFRHRFHRWAQMGTSFDLTSRVFICDHWCNLWPAEPGFEENGSFLESVALLPFRA